MENRKVDVNEMGFVEFGSLLKTQLCCAINGATVLLLDVIGKLKESGMMTPMVKQKVMAARKQLRLFENNMLWGRPKFFGVEYLSDEARGMYGDDVTDRDLLTFWQCSGAQHYMKNRFKVNDVKLTYERSMVAHGVKDAEVKAWCMTVMAMLETEVNVYSYTVRDFASGHGIPFARVDRLYGALCMKNVRDAWRIALKRIAPDIEYDIEESDVEAQEKVLDSMTEMLLDYKGIMEATVENVREFEELFRDGGEEKAIESLEAIKREL